MRRVVTRLATFSPAQTVPQWRGVLADVGQMDAETLGSSIRKALTEGDFGQEKWSSCAERASELAANLSLDQSARLAAVFSTARVMDFDLFTRLSERVMECLHEEPQVQPTAVDLRRLAIAFGHTKMFDGELMEALVPHIVDRVEDFRPRDLARIISAYARLPVQSPELFALVADALPQYFYDLSPPELVGVCRAFAEAAVYNADLIDSICADVVSRIRNFGALECLVFLEGLALLNEGLPEEMQRNDHETLAEVLRHLGRLLSVFSMQEMVRTFAALVQLDHYDVNMIHGRLIPSITQKLVQGQERVTFHTLAELLHCLGLMPSQSHASAELAITAMAFLRHRGRSWVPSEPRDVTLVATAMSELGQEDDEIYAMLLAMIRPKTSAESFTSESHPVLDLAAMASDQELMDMHRAFWLSKKGATAVLVLDAEIRKRGLSNLPKRDRL
mmetsp:Transcript_47964/g.104352  ORF Transcript_47964/g.104352 Transcript_47964/m.104352 type:complete len:447 (+) Transcript_47964:57-1397(+)